MRFHKPAAAFGDTSPNAPRFPPPSLDSLLGSTYNSATLSHPRLCYYNDGIISLNITHVSYDAVITLNLSLDQVEEVEFRGAAIDGGGDTVEKAQESGVSGLI